VSISTTILRSAPRSSNRWRIGKKSLRAFAAYTYELHQKGVWHLDYSPGNILIKRSDQGYQFSIVDINRMEFRPISALEGCENFNKLWASDEELEIMGREYARLSGLDETITIAEMKRHNDANKRIKNFKKRLKRWLKGDFSNACLTLSNIAALPTRSSGIIKWLCFSPILFQRNADAKRVSAKKVKVSHPTAFAR
jgi:hypothetical protein